MFENLVPTVHKTQCVYKEQLVNTSTTVYIKTEFLPRSKQLV